MSLQRFDDSGKRPSSMPVSLTAFHGAAAALGLSRHTPVAPFRAERLDELVPLEREPIIAPGKHHREREWHAVGHPMGKARGVVRENSTREPVPYDVERALPHIGWLVGARSIISLVGTAQTKEMPGVRSSHCRTVKYRPFKRGFGG